MRVELNGDNLPDSEDAERERLWSKKLGSEKWRIYTLLRQLCFDGETSIDSAVLARRLGVSANRLFTRLLPSLEDDGLVNHGVVDE